MDKDVESKMDKLCVRYGQAAATVGISKSRHAPTAKNRSRIEHRVRDTLTQLRESRRPECAALVRLAYVRGMRSVQPNAHMNDSQLMEVTELELQLDKRLAQVENRTLSDFYSHMRKLRAAHSLEEMDTNPHVVEFISQRASQPFPLEQHARASVRSVVEMASMAGALAGTQAASYDGVPNG